MSLRQWVGNAPVVNEQYTVAVTAITVGVAIGVTIAGKAVTYTPIADDTVTTACAGLVFSLQNTTIPEFAEIAFLTPTTAVATGGGTVAGGPVTLVALTGQTTVTNTVAATGPSWGNNAFNWFPVGVPVITDDIVFANCSVPLLYGMAGFTCATLKIYASMTGAIGLPVRAVTNSSALPGGGGYLEYRARELPVPGGVPIEIGAGEGTGSTFTLLKLGPAASAVLIHYTPENGSTTLVGANASAHAVTIRQGNLQLAPDPGQSITVGTLLTGGSGNTQGTGPQVLCGEGATVTNTTHNGGRIVSNSATTLTMNRFALSFQHLAGTLNATIYGGEIDYRSNGPLTVVAYGGKVNLANDPRPKTIAVPSRFIGAAMLDPNAVSTWTSPGIEFDVESIKRSDFGSRMMLQRTAL